jgi:hypothetical protein
MGIEKKCSGWYIPVNVIFHENNKILSRIDCEVPGRYFKDFAVNLMSLCSRGWQPWYTEIVSASTFDKYAFYEFICMAQTLNWHDGESFPVEIVSSLPSIPWLYKALGIR